MTETMLDRAAYALARLSSHGDPGDGSDVGEDAARFDVQARAVLSAIYPAQGPQASETTLETIAKAMWSEKFGAPITVLHESQWDDIFRDDWMKVARAALRAIREPDEAIQEAFYGEVTVTGEGFIRNLGAGFTAMIDSILSQSQEGK